MKLEYPKERPPEGKKWWWRPAYYSASMSFGGESTFRWGCPFCGKQYHDRADYHRVGFYCECGATFTKDPNGMFGLVDESFDEIEMWA